MVIFLDSILFLGMISTFFHFVWENWPITRKTLISNELCSKLNLKYKMMTLTFVSVKTWYNVSWFHQIYLFLQIFCSLRLLVRLRKGHIIKKNTFHSSTTQIKIYPIIIKRKWLLWFNLVNLCHNSKMFHGTDWWWQMFKNSRRILLVSRRNHSKQDVSIKIWRLCANGHFTSLCFYQGCWSKSQEK